MELICSDCGGAVSRAGRQRCKRCHMRYMQTQLIHPFDLAAYMRGRPAHNRKPVGTERIGNGHIQVKCADGSWRYRARLVWAETNGPIPMGILIHHQNGDPFDDRPSNLQNVTRAEHLNIHRGS